MTPLATLLSADPVELTEHYPTRAEKTADGLVHLIGMLIAGIGGGLIFGVAMTRAGLPVMTAVAVYALCAMLMLAASAVYNLTRPSPARRMLRRMDEAAIFLMIAGSYTPFAIRLLSNGMDTLVVTIVWVAALAGAAGKVFLPQLSDKFWCWVYLAFAWFSVALVGPSATHLGPVSIGLLALGGIVFSIGVPVYLNHALPYRRAIWHGLVVIGIVAHYAAVFTGVVLPLV